MFNLQIFGELSAVFLLLTSSLVLRTDVVWFLFLKFVKMCFMTQNVFYLGGYSMWPWEEQFVDAGWSSLYTSIIFSWWYCWIKPCLTDFLPVSSAHFWFRGVKVSKYDNRVIYFSSPLYLFCLTYFNPVMLGAWMSTIVFLQNWTLYHYVLSLFISYNFPFSDICSVWNIYSYSHFLFIRLLWYFFIP